MQLQQDARITVRVDKELKENAEALFNRLGMNTSVAINIFLRKAVIEQSIPFKIGLITGNESIEEITYAFRYAVAEEIADFKRKGLPVARYDEKKKKAYLEYPDGRKEYDYSEQ